MYDKTKYASCHVKERFVNCPHWIVSGFERNESWKTTTN